MPREKRNSRGVYRKDFLLGHDIDGKPVVKQVTSKSLEKFKKKCQELEKKYFLTTAEKFTVEQWGIKWLNTYKKDKIGTSQYNNYDGILRNHINPILGIYELNDIKPIILQDFMNRYSGGKKDTVSKILQTLKQMFDIAEANGYVEKNPALRLEMPKTTTQHRRALTQEEETLVRNLAETHSGGLWVLVMLDCGLRKGETAALKWSDIDFKNKILHVHSSVAFAGSNVGNIKDTKSESGNRYIPIPDLLLTKLKAEREKHVNKSGAVFLNTHGNPATATTLRRKWESFLYNLDILAGAEKKGNKIINHAIDQSLSPHYLRHTYATNLRKQGIDIKMAQYLLGHADIKTTGNIYTHIRKDDIITLSQAINSPEKLT